MVKTAVSGNRLLKTAEYIVEAIVLGWFSYLLIYQNYLLYKWHRGLPKPSKEYFVLAGFLIAATFLAYELLNLFNREQEKKKNDEGKEEDEETKIDGKENPEIKV